MQSGFQLTVGFTATSGEISGGLLSFNRKPLRHGLLFEPTRAGKFSVDQEV